MWTLDLAVPGDASFIAFGARDWVETGLGWRYTVPTVRDLMARADTRVVVAREGEHRLGFGIMSYGPETAHLALLGVHPGARRRGVGRALVIWLERIASEAGTDIVWVEARATNAEARALYASLGYRELAVTAGYYGRREDAVRLGKDLGA